MVNKPESNRPSKKNQYQFPNSQLKNSINKFFTNYDEVLVLQTRDPRANPIRCLKKIREE
jgi:hypothetical protein